MTTSAMNVACNSSPTASTTTAAATTTSPTTNYTGTNNNNNNNNGNTVIGMCANIAATQQQHQQQQQQQLQQQLPQHQQQQLRTMQTDEDFNIRFVNLVRTHKCLYDKKVPEYRNRDNQEKAWSLISKETRESVIHCKERWRNLRACLSRYIKQQSGAEPQHKPYYLTEHMAFLLPFLKSTRNSIDGGINGSNSLATLFQISQQQQLQQVQHNQPHIHLVPPLHFGADQQQHMEMKHSLSEKDDEETIDAFDPAIAGNLQLRHPNNCNTNSPPLSDTASANTMQNFIPDVQLSELRTPDVTVEEAVYTSTQTHEETMRRGSHEYTHDPKRIKTECHASEATTTAHLQMYSAEHSDMEFFRSILPDIAALTAQQKRKFKIGVLELIDDVAERYPIERCMSTGSSSGKGRRNSTRDWRK